MMMKRSREFRHDPHYLEFMRHFIPEALRILGRARPKDLERCFRETLGRPVSDDTLRRYAELMVEEGLLRREVIIDNHDPDKSAAHRRRYRMVWYLLA